MDDADALTDTVLARIDRGADPRFRRVMSSLIRHLHDFAREVELTGAEWRAGVDFLTAAGQKSDARRQEVILLSDVLGLSTLVDALAHRGPAGATESTILGPFFVEGAPELGPDGVLAGGQAGEPLVVEGRVTDLEGRPVAGARLDVWQADGEGLYDVQRPGATPALRGWLRTGADGAYRFRTLLPSSYPVPVDGPVGRLLDALGRPPFRPAHVHFMVRAAGHPTLVTHMFLAGDPHLGSDAVFGVKQSLVVEPTRAEDARLARFDLVLGAPDALSHDPP